MGIPVSNQLFSSHSCSIWVINWAW